MPFQNSQRFQRFDQLFSPTLYRVMLGFSREGDSWWSPQRADCTELECIDMNFMFGIIFAYMCWRKWPGTCVALSCSVGKITEDYSVNAVGSKHSKAFKLFSLWMDRDLPGRNLPKSSEISGKIWKFQDEEPQHDISLVEFCSSLPPFHGGHPLQVNHHFRNRGSFWRMVKLLTCLAKLLNQPNKYPLVNQHGNKKIDLVKMYPLL